MKTNLLDEALSLLNKDRERNVNMLNFMRNYPVSSIMIKDGSVLVRGRSDENWVYISSKSEEEFRKLIQELNEEDKCFAILEDWMLPHITKGREVRSKLTSMKLVYDSDTPPMPNKFDCIPLSASDAATIFEHSKYQEYITIDYITERIINGIGFGIREKEKLVAWALTHDDGAIGFLNVLEQYRGRGYGKDITAAMVKRLLEVNEIPYVHIEEDNVKSMNLAVKMGFRKYRRIHWLKF